MIFRKIRCFWSVTHVSCRIFRVLHVLNMFCGIAYGTIEFRLCIFADFSGFERVPVILDGSDTDFNNVSDTFSACVWYFYRILGAESFA